MEKALDKMVKGHSWCIDTASQLHQPADCYRSFWNGGLGSRGYYPKTLSGQQCCYAQTKEGALITRDGRAGTPDKFTVAYGRDSARRCLNWSKAAPQSIAHGVHDVFPYIERTDDDYFIGRPPSGSDFERYTIEVATGARTPYDVTGLDLSLDPRQPQ